MTDKELAKDATRYRWLAKQLLENDVTELKAWLWDNITIHRRSMNEAIDAELLAEKEDN